MADEWEIELQSFRAPQVDLTARVLAALPEARPPFAWRLRRLLALATLLCYLLVLVTLGYGFTHSSSLGPQLSRYWAGAPVRPPLEGGL